MNIQEAWDYGRFHLSTISPTPDLDARLLLEHVLQKSHSHLVAHGDRPLSAAQQQRYLVCIRRARRKEPIPYISGLAPFYGRDFQVSPAVLIPRPETERLVELAIRWARPRGARRIADVGTGSGCIAVTLALHLPQAEIIAGDISAASLALARANGQRLAPGRVRFVHGHLLEPIPGPLDLIAANLPYVTEGEWTQLDDGVKLYEPAVALKGGADGLDLIGILLEQAASRLNSAGMLLLEIGWRQGAAAQALAARHFPDAAIRLVTDYAGHDRIVVIEKD
jgi:release factor glutamine methyltransferase